ncbi:hypothetical protein ACOQFV_16080 [Nocardiopsis changdeensis]|uniref:Uncharacterized protein n=1 Tax=Nocardiopsis changdeensis TaxID=2831969 RepID=A0ABX8BHK0_9ACTN|nr:MULTISPECIES: hypothetical protein [Nocardiopsis]QUX21534.1 hypothetical protein KGD84_24485 [Nocardiopsis changdeensis]QYX37467.1 hypothetical protein K1J57_01855 [Nocardiopsis sp. MT53]
MSDEWTSEQRAEVEAAHERYTEIERREDIKLHLGSMVRIYINLHSKAPEGSPEREEYKRLIDYWTDRKKRRFSMSREEGDRILRELPQEVARLKREHGL